jgi:hypothetical protein
MLVTLAGLGGSCPASIESYLAKKTPPVLNVNDSTLPNAIGMPTAGGDFISIKEG